MSTAEREIFTELFWKIRNLKYVPNAAEMDTLKACEAEAYNRAGARALVFGGASLGVFTLLGMTRTRKLASYGLSICNAAGGAYYGAKSTSTYCLECLVKLDSPIGGELAVIMARRCPDSALVNQSPWAEAIVQSRSESDSSSGGRPWTPDNDVDTNASLDVDKRIATPEAIAALRAMRKEMNQSSQIPSAQSSKGSEGRRQSVRREAREREEGSFMTSLWGDAEGDENNDGEAGVEDEDSAGAASDAIGGGERRGRRRGGGQVVDFPAEEGEFGETQPARGRRDGSPIDPASSDAWGEEAGGPPVAAAGGGRRRRHVADQDDSMSEMQDPWDSPQGAERRW
eukprot:CAMPEP_0177751994 /NCGR_PEP_ID=MMETSP0491_2-20121128/681_1 /TAXON_ID=63592 /ORGANISM="Tetraselmis chuii, Strain PLY429" /LENGTH=341 /DNA_ID=CAMNT_0019267165 /DNA_START=241 /DNA_END=1266 /DNA_ORIENTATION=-